MHLFQPAVSYLSRLMKTSADYGDVDACIDVHFGDADVIVELVILLSLSWW